MENNRLLYAELLKQELIFWYNHPETLTQKDFNLICKRRGFTKKEINLLLISLDQLGLKVK